jgi:Fe2+ or Zn2+ uptake regulation protein
MDLGTTRMTPQRRAVLDVLAASDDHPTAAEVLERVRRLMPGVGAATVYRTLALVVQSGECAQLRISEEGTTRYDRTVRRHDHLVCTECGRVDDVQIALDTRVLHEAAKPSSFSITSYDVHIQGRCAMCAAEDRHNPGGN